MRVTRLLNAPIITPDLHPSIGHNIQGPSLIRVPDWVPEPLGSYYLYFADHKGRYIRLAYTDNLRGPWKIHPPGTLQLAESHFPTQPLTASPKNIAQIKALWHAEKGPQKLPHDLMTEATTPHIASPDVHVNHTDQTIVMYYHGLEKLAHQISRVATSADGINFTARPKTFAKSYLRIFRHAGYVYGMAMPGQFYRSANGLSHFEEGPLLFNKNMRHAALLKRENTLYIFWTQVGDVPESILLSTIDISVDWQNWRETKSIEILRPEHPYEGADAPLEPSIRSVAYGHVNQLRDPAIFEENDHIYLLYAIAGESGIAIAEVEL